MAFDRSSSLHDQLQKKCFHENIPLGAVFEITSKCNLKCRHCYMVRDGSIELSTDEVMEIIDQLYSMGTTYLGLTGGEIFAREDLFEILRYIRKKGFILSLLTNGTLITQEKIEEITKMDPLFFEISVYGATANTHDNITRVKGSFERTMKTVEAMLQQGIDIKIKTPIMNLNVRESDNISALCKELGTKHIMNPGIVPARNGSKDPMEFDLSDEDLKKYLLKNDFELGYLQEKDPDRGFICTAGRSLCGITASGTVYPCIMMPMPVGNLRERSFKDIWIDNPIKDLKRLRALTNQDMESCYACDLRRFCIRCPGVVYLETGDMVGAAESICKYSGWKKILHDRQEVALI